MKITGERGELAGEVGERRDGVVEALCSFDEEVNHRSRSLEGALNEEKSAFGDRVAKLGVYLGFNNQVSDSSFVFNREKHGASGGGGALTHKYYPGADHGRTVFGGAEVRGGDRAGLFKLAP